MSGSVPAGGALDLQQIMLTIPHRPPFLLVDRVLDCQPGKLIRGYKNVTGSDWDRMLCSPLIVIEAIAQVAVILTTRTMDAERPDNVLFFFAGIEHAEFRGSPRPGDRLDLYSEVEKIRRGIGWFRGTASVAGREIVAVRMQAARKAA